MHLVAQLDQMNTYLILLTPILPKPYQSDWRKTIEAVSRIIISKFYSPSSKLLFLNANSTADTDLTSSGTDLWRLTMGIVTSPNAAGSPGHITDPKFPGGIIPKSAWGPGGSVLLNLYPKRTRIQR